MLGVLVLNDTNTNLAGSTPARKVEIHPSPKGLGGFAGLYQLAPGDVLEMETEPEMHGAATEGSIKVQVGNAPVKVRIEVRAL